MKEIKNFRKNPLDVERLSALVAAPDFADTMALDVTENPIGDAGVKAIAASPHGKIKALWIDRTGVTDDGATALGGSKLPLEELYIGYNKVGPDGLKALLEAPAAQWKILRLSFNALTDAGAQHLAQSSKLGTLERLELVSTGLTDGGLQALVSSTTLTRLDTLDVGHNTFGPNGLEPLINPAHLPALKTLYTEGSCCDAALLKRLSEARPQLEVKTGC